MGRLRAYPGVGGRGSRRQNVAVFLSSLYGEVVASDVDLHLAAPPAPTAVDLTIRRSSERYDPEWAPDPAELVTRWWYEEGGYGYLTARIPGGYRLRFHDYCEFDLTADLDDACYRMADGKSLEWIPIMATGTLMTLRLLLRGELVLHSSVVDVDGRGLAFVGNSGQGKSTMATLLCAHGATLVTDDVGRVRFDGDRAWIIGGGQESRLRPSAAGLVDRVSTAGMPTRDTVDGRAAITLPRCDRAETALHAVVVPMPRRDGGPLKLAAVPPLTAVPLLSAYPRVQGVLDPTLTSRSFHRIVDLVQRVPVHVAAVPWGNPPDPDVAAQLLVELGWR